MSLFTALVPAPEALAHLAAAVEPARARWPGLRWVRAERWHVTVAFLGQVADDVVPRLVAETAEAVAGVPVARLRLAGAGEFPGRGRPLRVLWVGATGVPTGLVAASEGAARACGIALERREHVPHLTLARAPGRPRPAGARVGGPSGGPVPGPASGAGGGAGRGGPDGGGPVEALAAYAGPVRPVPALALLRSRPGAGGPHEVVARFPLAGAEGDEDSA